MTKAVLCSKPSAFLIYLDGELLQEAGNKGVIGSQLVAERLRDSLVSQYPEKPITLFGVFTFRKEHK